MRVAYTPEDFPISFHTAQKEAHIAFGDNTMYIEHLVEHPRHIEFHHQKLIEESPCSAISEELRQKMGEAAVKAANAAHY